MHCPKSVLGKTFVLEKKSVGEQRAVAQRICGILKHSLLWVAIVALSACESTPYPSTSQTPNQEPSAGRSNADALVRLATSASDVAGADGASGSEAASLWLAAAQALANEARNPEAQDALARVTSSALDANEAFAYGALSAELALGRFDGPTARAFVAQLQPQTTDQQQRYTALTDTLKTLNVDPAAAASALINSQTPRSRAAAQQRSDQIWALISQVPAGIVAEQANTTSGVERNWWQLKDQLLGAFTMADAATRLRRWQSGNPVHPASQTPPTSLTAIQSERRDFTHIAMLIPQTGPLAAAGNAVRDGFLAAHLHAGQSVTAASSASPGSFAGTQSLPNGARQITVLDSTSSPLPDLLQQAEAAGADLIVGPLDKNRVAQLNQLPRNLPTLLLNYLPTDTMPRGDIVQFGLAVEDEAAAIARRVQAEGLERVVVLHNEKDWSARARDALLDTLADTALDPSQAALERSPSQAVGIGSTPDVKQLTAVVGSTLLVDASQQRHRRLERLVGEDLEFVPRARQDVDAIVAFLDAAEARALRPALRFHFASHVPVYTSSQALRRVSKRDLRDLRGFNVSEIPWKLYPSPIKASVETAFGVTQGGLVPLYALGVDAYRLADRLDLLLTQPHQRLLGGTGELSIEYGGRVRRDLAWQYVGQNGLMALPMVVSQ